MQHTSDSVLLLNSLSLTGRLRATRVEVNVRATVTGMSLGVDAMMTLFDPALKDGLVRVCRINGRAARRAVILVAQDTMSVDGRFNGLKRPFIVHRRRRFAVHKFTISGYGIIRKQKV